MKFTVSDTYVQRQARRGLWIGLMFTFFFVGCIAYLIKAEKFSAMVMPAVAAYFFVNGIWAMFKRRRDGAAAYVVFELDEAAGTLVASHNEVTITMPLDQITGLRLQYQSGQLVSVLAQTRSSGQVRFEGYERLEALAEALRSHVPAEKIKIAKFYHR